MPKQLSTNGTNVGAHELLAQELAIMGQISGLSGAIQGHMPRAGTPTSLYAQETQNSALNFTLLFKCFQYFCEERDEKLLKVLMQYYNTRRYVAISGSDYSETANYYEPEMVRRIEEFNLATSKSNDTPVFRQIADDFLMRLLEAGQIPLEVFLDNTSLPFADKLLNDIKTLKEQAAAGQVDPALLGQMKQQAEQNADPRAMALLQKAIGGA